MILNMLKFDFVNNGLKKPLIMIYMFGYPLILFIILSSITSSMFTGGISSRDYYGVTSMIFIQLSMGTMISNMILENSVKSSNMRLGYIVDKPFYIVLSKIIVLIIWNILSIIFYIIVCQTIFHVHFGKLAFGVGLIYLSCGLLSISFGVLLCHILKDESLTNNLLGAVQTIVCIAGGVFFQPWILGKDMVLLSKMSLAKWIIFAISNGIYEHQVTLLIVLSAGFLFAAVLIIMIVNKFFKLENYLR